MLNKNSNYTLVMICLNEIDGIKHIAKDVNKYLSLLNDVIFIDGGSTDGSAEMAKENGWSVFLQDKNNMGVLNGIKLGLEKCRTDYVIFFSPDNNCKPDAIPALISDADKGNDLVISGNKNTTSGMIFSSSNENFSRVSFDQIVANFVLSAPLPAVVGIEIWKIFLESFRLLISVKLVLLTLHAEATFAVSIVLPPPMETIRSGSKSSVIFKAWLIDWSVG